MLRKLIEKHKQTKAIKQYRKPTYKLGDLYIGEIVLYKYRENVDFGIIDHHYEMVKKFGFFIKIGYEKYRHIISGQELFEIDGHQSTVGDFTVNRVRKFEKASPIYMRKNNLSSSDKTSKAFIEKYEQEMNKILAPEQVVDELFK